MNLPPQQDIESAWYGPLLASRPDQWTVILSDVEIAELEWTADEIIRQAIPIPKITRQNFRLPVVENKLRQLARRIIDGIGFSLVKRLPIERYSAEKAAIIFYGLGTHLGNARMQNADGHVLGHVRDLNLRSDNPDVRIYQTNERQSFHTDSCDIVGLLCLQTARRGGDSLLVSAVTIFNEMRETRPDLLQLLFDPVATDRRGEVPVGMKPYFSIPVFNWYQGYLTVMYQRQYIDSAQRFSDAFRLTPAHVEALDLFDNLANDQRLNISMHLETGDMQFVYNHGLLHDRTAFEDWPDSKYRRHLLRLWLSVPGDRPLPDVFRQRYGSIQVGNRGGVAIEEGLVASAPVNVTSPSQQAARLNYEEES